ncbi:MAG: stage II sporulation protein R [Bacillota bacterium]|nr:stage II sporulation protein R [Bacillota bacterium]
MKKTLRIGLLILLAAFAYLLGSGKMTSESNAEALSNEDFIRLHVIANSDSEADQDLKLEVRDAILEALDEGLAAEAFARADGGETGAVSLDKEEFEEYLTGQLGEIETLARQVVRENGCGYGAEAELTVCWIPEKTYESVTFPAGNYEALRVVLGEGGGQNWWCVLFPPLCLIGVDAPEETPAGEGTEWALDQRYDVLFTEGGQPVELKLRFKTLELL